ncbi:MAG: TIGR04222 domain-containing membrane protein [Planctomycetota bacterium]
MIGGLILVLSSATTLTSWITTVSGGDFLAAYVAMLVVAFAFGGAFRLGRFLAGVGERGESLTAYEAAYLAGGDARLTEAVTARMLRAECVAVEPVGRRLRVGERKLSEPDAFESGVYAIASARGDVKDARRSVGHASSVLEQDLNHRGLAQTVWARGVWAFLTASPLLLVLAVGAWRTAIGLQRGKPVGFLLVLMVVGLVLTGGLMLTEGPRTSAGSASLRRMRRQRSRGLDRRAATSSDYAWVTGLYGVGALPSDAQTLQHAFHPPAAGGDSGGGWFGGCGADSGGGGGGCGGCGS